MVDSFFSPFNDLLLFNIIVEYLWNYMRNNQKPRSSVLRKKSGKVFVRIQRSIRIDVHLMLMVELFEGVLLDQFCMELCNIFKE